MITEQDLWKGFPKVSMCNVHIILQWKPEMKFCIAIVIVHSKIWKRNMSKLLTTVGYTTQQWSIKLAKQSIAPANILPQKTGITNHIYWCLRVVCRRCTCLTVTKNIYNLDCLMKCVSFSHLDRSPGDTQAGGSLVFPTSGN